MIAALGFFDAVEIVLEVLGVRKGRRVDAREHPVLFVAAPVGPGHGKQLERLDAAGVRDVRPTAKVDEIAVAVQGNGAVVQPFHKLDLVGFAHVGEKFHGVGLGNIHPLKGNGGIDDTPHFRFNGFKILGSKGLFYIEVIIEAVFDGGTDGHLGGGKKLLDGRGHDVGGGVAQKGQAFGRIGGHGSQLGSLSGRRGDGRSQVKQPFPNLAGKGRLETLSAQPLFQGIRTGCSVRDLNQLSFNRDLHGSTFLASELIRKKKKQGGR